MTERVQRLQVERESLESKMEAEKHVMRAQLRDLMEKQQADVRRLSAEHELLLAHSQQVLLGQLEEMRSRVSSSVGGQLPAAQRHHATDSSSTPRLAELEGWECCFQSHSCILDNYSLCHSCF